MYSIKAVQSILFFLSNLFPKTININALLKYSFNKTRDALDMSALDTIFFRTHSSNVSITKLLNKYCLIKTCGALSR